MTSAPAELTLARGLGGVIHGTSPSSPHFLLGGWHKDLITSLPGVVHGVISHRVLITTTVVGTYPLEYVVRPWEIDRPHRLVPEWPGIRSHRMLVHRSLTCVLVVYQSRPVFFPQILSRWYHRSDILWESNNLALRIRFQYPTGSNLGYSLERLSDYLWYDFATGTFVAQPTQPIAPLPEDTGNFTGRYILTMLATDPTIFTNGDYVVTVHDRNANNVVVAELTSTFYQGDDSTQFHRPGRTPRFF